MGISDKLNQAKDAVADAAQGISDTQGAEPGSRGDGAALDKDASRASNPVEKAVDDLDEDPQN